METPPYPRTCGAKTKSTGKPCKNAPMANGRCRFHGGLTPSGPNSANWKHGRYSKDVPAQLAPRYQAGLQGDMLRLDDDIAMIEARIGQLLASIDDNPAGDWLAADKALRAYQAAGRAQNVSKAAATLHDLQETISAGVAARQTWGELYDLFELHRKMIETQRKTIVDLKQMFTAAQGLAMIGVLEEILRARISDARLLATIGSDIDRRFGVRAGATIEQSAGS